MREYINIQKAYQIFGRNAVQCEAQIHECFHENGMLRFWIGDENNQEYITFAPCGNWRYAIESYEQHQIEKKLLKERIMEEHRRKLEKIKEEEEQKKMKEEQKKMKEEQRPPPMNPESVQEAEPLDNNEEYVQMGVPIEEPEQGLFSYFFKRKQYVPLAEILN